MNATAESQTLNLPGYTLSHRLGAGGYGEVWQAQAPGGLTKAVKFIYGAYHERRAEHELKALARIKEVRHPFLLSLERIEVIDGRLVIVTELADGSLKDRFDECQQRGELGIPREELLGYLRDAADALDFLAERHSLQHLDVKPENLLLVGGHVKVADFGLVKDVGAAQASLVGGLTPLYSAPEVFQGAPSNRSDQYSLAVLYQEMLTGEPPFAGVTAAELTLQHLHDEPELAPLPLGDRYVAARALAKDPEQRFASCGEFVQALRQQEQTSEVGWSAPSPPGVSDAFEVAPSAPAPPRPGPVTQLFGEQVENPRAPASKSMLLELPDATPREIRELSPLDLRDFAFQPTPTVIIGVGGLAAQVLRGLRQQIAKRCGDEPLPAVRMLLIDSDPKTVSLAMQGDSRSALGADETLTLPLRRPQEYRDQSDRLMRWLSRRWLYNIPRSLRTEGLRPLGRLAFADHARQAMQRIRMAIAAATSAESVDAANARLGCEFRRDSVRVIVVAAISGGSGSGMSLDLGYAARTALAKLGLEHAQVTGVFLHAASGDPRRCDLAKVNSYAWLTEYNHFHRPGGVYPGDESCGLPPAPAPQRAFDAAYLVEIEGAPTGEENPRAVDSVADYLYLETLTPAQAFFDLCRQEGDDLPCGDAPLRTFSVERQSAVADASIEKAAGAVARAVVLQWTGGEEFETPQCLGAAATPKRDTDQLVAGAAQFVSSLQLKLEGLASHARGLIDAQFGGDLPAFAAKLFAPDNATKGPAPAETIRAIDALFAPPSEHDQGAFVLQRPLEAIVSPLTMKLAGDVARWVLTRLDDRQQRLAGAQRAANWVADHLKCVDADALRLAAALARQVNAAHDSSKSARDGGSLDERINKVTAYLRLRTDHQAVVAAGVIVRKLLAELKGLDATLTEFGRHLRHLAKNLPGGEREDAGDDDSFAASDATDALAALVEHRLPALADAVGQQLQAELIDQHGGLFQTMMGHSRVRAQMLAALPQMARSLVEGLAAEPEALERAFVDVGSQHNAAPDGVAAARPPLLARGGLWRRLLVIPGRDAEGQPADLAHAALVGPASMVRSDGHDLFVCSEAWALPLPLVAAELIQSRKDYADFASRVHTRSDVAWLPLNGAVSCGSTPGNSDYGCRPEL